MAPAGFGLEERHGIQRLEQQRLYTHQQLDLTTASELRRALVHALAELHASRAAHQAELLRMESEAARRSCPPRPSSETSSGGTGTPFCCSSTIRLLQV